MRKILLTCCAAFTILLTGCGANYERSTNAGSVVIAQFDDMKNKMENDETFVMAFSQANCSHCITFREKVLPKYLADHEIVFYEVLLDIQKDMNPLYDFVKENPNPEKFLSENMKADSIYTPTFYFVDDGKVEDIWIGEISEDELDKLVVKYQLDKAK